MDFGICVASKMDEVSYMTHAENLEVLPCLES